MTLCSKRLITQITKTLLQTSHLVASIHQSTSRGPSAFNALEYSCSFSFNPPMMDAANDEGASPPLEEDGGFSLESMGFTSFGKKVQPPKYIQQQQILSGTATNLTPLGLRPTKRSSAEDSSIASSSPLPSPPIPVPPPAIDTFNYSNPLNSQASYETSFNKGSKSKRGGRGNRGGGRGGGFQQRGTHSYHPYSRPSEPHDTSALGTNSDDIHLSDQANPRTHQQNHWQDPVFGPGYYKPSFIEDPWKNL